MKSPLQVKKDENSMRTLAKLTTAFEGIASAHLANIRSDVITSSTFFDSMWNVYNDIRVDKVFHFGRQLSKVALIDKELFILITAEGGFSGDLDSKVVNALAQEYDPNKHEIIVVGRHGVNQLNQRGIKFTKYYRLPSRDQNINVEALVNDVKKYRASRVFYSKYLTFTNQETKSINVSALVQELTETTTSSQSDDIISELNYIFEPDVYEVVDHMETTMLYVSMSQLLLESKMAQYAARYKAMALASNTAQETSLQLHTQYRRAVRTLQDDSLKEILNSIRSVKQAI